ncbi:MAG: mechanosensitive ion channel family protein [Verrucomicrobiales bacterium]|nr:mechanosensitive ion channel family protein [Verrucomicrobiales bacterium]
MIRFLPLAALLFFSGLASAQEIDSGNNTPIEVEKITSDTAIKNRLREIYDAVGGFDSVEITVKSGVVTLRGEVPSARVQKDAVSLSDRTGGVVLTINRLTEPTEITSRFAPAYEKLQQMGRGIVMKLPLLGAALIILILSGYFAKLVGQRHRWLDRLPFSSLGRQLALRAVRGVIMIVGILFALELLDATAIVGAVMGAAGLAGLALGFAFKNIVENYLAGVLLSTRNPFEIGDAVEIDGQTGKVARLTSRDTVLVTLDGNHLRIPNAKVMNSVLLNYSRNPLRRFDFYVGVSTEFDLTEVKRIAMETLKENPAVLDDPAPMVAIDSLGDSAIQVRLFAWLDQSKHSFLKVKSESIRLIKEAFDEAGIEMPEPIYRVHLRERLTALSESVSGEKPKPETVSAPVTEEDISADDAIDDQIEAEALNSTEENLLHQNPSGKKNP